MSTRSRLLVAIVMVALASVSIVPAQFGGFGRNKVKDKVFDWKVYKSPHFDVYYYPEAEILLEEVVNEAESAYLDISRRLEHEVTQRIPLVMYRTHGEFRRTNIQLQELPEGVGAFAEPFQGRMVLPVDDPPEKRYKLIRHELTHIFEFDILYGGSLRRTLRGQPPLWLMEGLASYLGDDEDAFDQMIIRDAVVNNLVPSVYQLNVLSFLTYRYGHALFDFIEEEWGAEGVRTFLFEFRKSLLNQNLEKPFQDAFGLSVDQFDRRFARFLRKRYLPILTGKRSPDEYGKEIGLSKPGRFTFSPALSPSGELVAALATPGMELDVVILSARDGEIIRNLTKGFSSKYDSVATGAFEGKRDLAWSADGQKLAFFVERQLHRELLIYNPINGRKLDRIPIKDLDEPSSPAFSPDGKWVAFSANAGGQWDIYRLNLEDGTRENLTSDTYFDTNPIFSPEGEQVLYNRRIGTFDKIFAVQVGSPERKVQLTAGASSDLQPSLSRDGKWIFFSSDRGEFGVFNVHRLNTETGDVERLTDLVGGAFGPVELSEAADGSTQLAYSTFFGGTFRVFRMKVAGEEVEAAIEAGKREPQNSPLAPSRQEEQKRRREQRLEAEAQKQTHMRRRSSVPLWPAMQTSWPSFASDQLDVLLAQQGGDDSGDDDLKPFQAPLQLGVDESRKEEYKSKWSLEAPSISVGVTDDGRFLSNFALQFSDLLGNQRIFVSQRSVDDFTNLQAIYLNSKRRFDWGASVIDYRDFFLTADGAGNVNFERELRLTSASAFFAYPFNRNYRFESYLAYTQQRNDSPRIGPSGITFVSQDNDYPSIGFAFVGDTTRYQSFGPFQGRRFRVGMSYLDITSGDLDGQAVLGYNADFRFYQKVTRRSLLALRFSALLQEPRGDGQGAVSIYTLGGLNQLRGIPFRALQGENILFGNFEFRFPIIDALQWSFGLPMGPIRGFLFVDAGSAWYADEVVGIDPTTMQPIRDDVAFDPFTGNARIFETSVNGMLQDLHVTAGVGFNLNFLGLPMNFSFSRRWNGDDFVDRRSDFYIVFDW